MSEGGGSLGDVELFDPARNTVRQLSPLAMRRAAHTATPLKDGRVLVVGGYNGEYLASVEIFDPATRRFRAAGSLTEPRSGHTATLLPDGRVLIAGGIGRGWTFLRSAELYDPQTGRSTAVAPMAVARESHTATLLRNGQVLIAGGHTGRRPNMTVHASAELFDPRTGRFAAAGTLGTPRHKHDAVRLADGRVLIIAGADHTDRLHYATTEVYEPAARKFTPGPSLAHRRYKIVGTSVLLPSGNVLVPAGAKAGELLDVKSWKFREIDDAFPAAYRYAATAMLPNGDVFIAGGYSDDNENTAGVWRFVVDFADSRSSP
jgi:hypothetical protein